MDIQNIGEKESDQGKGLGLVLRVCPKGYPSVLEGEVMGKMG